MPIHHIIDVYEKIRLMRVRAVTPSFPLVANGLPVRSTIEKANRLCQSFQASGHGLTVLTSGDFNQVIVDSWSGDADYCGGFTDVELSQALSNLRMTSPGGDSIHNGFLRALSDDERCSILQLFNQSLQLGVVPESWKEGIVIPIVKSGKDPSLTTSYRPITLLSCLSKLMERLVATRLEYVVEQMSLLSPVQCGFRRGHSTLDVLLRLEDCIRRAQSSSDVCLVVHADLKAAFDKVWVDGLLYKLARASLCGALMWWLHSYLTSRTARVRVNGVLSHSLPLLACIPQGSVLSPLLFNLMLLDVPQLP